MKMFPILGERGFPMPWSIIQLHEGQALRNHGQSLHRLAERGGLAPAEALAVLEDRDWKPVSDSEAKVKLMAIINERQALMAVPENIVRSAEAIAEDPGLCEESREAIKLVLNWMKPS